MKLFGFPEKFIDDFVRHDVATADFSELGDEVNEYVIPIGNLPKDITFIRVKKGSLGPKTTFYSSEADKSRLPKNQKVSISEDLIHIGTYWFHDVPRVSDLITIDPTKNLANLRMRVYRNSEDPGNFKIVSAKATYHP